MTKSLASSKIQLHWLLYVSATSCFAFWARFVSCKATLLNLGPLPLKFSRSLVPPILNLLDIFVDPYLFSVQFCGVVKFAAANLQ